MKWPAKTLWDLMGVTETPVAVAPPPPRKPRATPDQRGRPTSGGGGMQVRYDALVDEMKRTYNLRVRKWRSSTTGCAWAVAYDDGTISHLIEAPYPRVPVS